MEHSDGNIAVAECEMKIGSQAYHIHKVEHVGENKSLTLNDIINHIQSLKENTDPFLQKIIDNNKFLIQDTKNKTKKPDEEEGDEPLIIGEEI